MMVLRRSRRRLLFRSQLLSVKSRSINNRRLSLRERSVLSQNKVDNRKGLIMDQLSHQAYDSGPRSDCFLTQSRRLTIIHWARILQSPFLLMLFNVCSTAAMAQDSTEPIWAPVERAIEKRRELATCWKYEVEAVIVTAPGHLDGMFSGVDPAASATPSPSRTYEARKAYQFDFVNGRVRIDDYEPFHTPTGMEKEHKIRLFDGETGVVLSPYAKAGIYKSSSKAAVQISSLYGFIGQIYPLLFASGIFEPAAAMSKRKFSTLSETGGEWAVEGPYITWLMPVQQFAGKFKFYFDPNQKYHVARCDVVYPATADGVEYPVDVTEITYDMSAGDGRVVSWTYSHPGSIEKSYRVVRAERVDSIPIDVFQEPADYVQPGMFVTKDKRPHIVTEQKTIVPWRPDAPLPAKPTYWPWFVVPVCLGIGIWYYRRMRT